MENEIIDINELSEKVMEGMEKAIKNLVESSALKNEELIIRDKDGNIKSVPAKDLLHLVQK
jgi:hypothetical protein